MWKVTLKNVAAHKLRVLLTGLAAVLGVAFLSGTLVLTSTIERTFNDLIADINAGVDVEVRGVEPFDSDFAEVPREPLPIELVETVRIVDGVAVAEPSVEVPYAQLVDENGDPVGDPTQGPPTFGFSYLANEELNPMNIVDGFPPANDDEIVIDKNSAEKGDFEVGDTAGVLTREPEKQYRISGIARFGTADSPLGASITQFTLREAQRINGFEGQVSTIDVIGREGVTEEELRDRVATAVANPSIEVVTGTELTEEDQSDITQFLTFFNILLVFFAIVALVVAIFIIYNTFSIVVFQRAREMALLRAIGASRRQVRMSVTIESLIVGLIASAIGLVLGIVLSRGLKALLAAFGFDIPSGGIVVTNTTVISAFVVGTFVTMLSAIVPARRASRVPPIAAIRAVAFERTGGFGRRTVIGLAMVLLGAGGMLLGLFGNPGSPLAFVGGGAGLIFVGVFVLGPVIGSPISRFIGAPLPKMKGMTGTLARENATRNPRRTAATASALMVGVALVGFITIFAASAKASIAEIFREQLATDYIVSSGSGFNSVGFSPVISEQMAALPEMSAVTGLRFGPVIVDGAEEFVTGSDPRPADQLVDFDTLQGSIGDLTDDGVATSKDYADGHDLGLGDTVAIQYPTTGVVSLEIQAIYERRELADNFLVTLGNYEQNFPPALQIDFLVLADRAPGVSDEEARAAIEPILEPYPTASLLSNDEFAKEQASTVDTILNLFYALLAEAIVIAVFGIVITLVLSVSERTREIGLLRAVGMSRSQVRSAVRWESVIIALLGTTLGLGVAVFFGWAVVTALKDDGLGVLSLAPVSLALIVVIAAFIGVLAGVYPAWRASRLDVLESIATE